MRFRKGSEVEVFSSDGAPYGAWLRAEIISGNGHMYMVRFDTFRFAKDEVVVERFPRKNIRPCPPQVEVARWESGELVEVLEDFSWKIATVLKALGGSYYRVRLLGASAEFEVHKVDIRVRQSWQDDRWFLIGKVSGSLKSSTLTGSDVHQKPQALLNNPLLREPRVASSKMLKRVSPYCWSECAESCTGNPRKKRSVEKEGEQHRYPSLSLQKVDAVACRSENLGKKRAQGSFKNDKNGCCEMVRVRSNGLNECVRAGNTEANGYDSDACSVGSCSVVSYNESNMPTCMLDGANQDADPASSDAESSSGHGEERQNSLADDEAAERC
ncbi:PREDICTED: uncharacterized protein LOC104818626 isoform X3 [Tarenaya hassleriana]|uniref:uncharacterized protein LOC104818626 isoform X3 n=1 Tax=Tarenaya hassleriana TaxID=28532 RepID=UPI00053C9359|nr:PREDICTED: uncharacterized protein LOC104818626 isoform X3 [Tarenaya hassleriana]